MRGPLEIVRRALTNAGRPLRLLARRSALPRTPGLWLVVRLAPPLDELAGPSLRMFGEPSLSLLDVLRTLEHAARDPSVDGVLLRLQGAPRGFGRVLALQRAVAQLRARGKAVAAYGDNVEAEDLLIASAAQRIWLPETGHVPLVGLRADAFFLKALLDRVGVEADVVRVGRSKTAAEMFTRERMSPEQREQVEALLDDLYGELVDGVARGRGLSPERVRELVDGGPYTARAAVRAGLVDGCLYEDELPEALEPLTPAPPPERPGPRRAQLVDAATYHALVVRDPGWLPLFADIPRLAYVVLAGAIHAGRGLRGVAGESATSLLDSLREDPGVRGVVLRVDSPGGDSLTSDLLWRSVERLRREKPVVVSMGNTAASGGYYLAAGADRVFAESGTLTGSIGVVGGKVNLEGLYARAGVGRDAVERGERAGMFSETRAFTPGERKAVQETMESVYGHFIERVARGRRLTHEAVEAVAEGRVWSGRRAREVGLVDALGGPLEALREVRRQAGFQEGERLGLDVLPRIPRLAGLRGLLGP